MGTADPAAEGLRPGRGVDVSMLERIETPKGQYLAYREAATWKGGGRRAPRRARRSAAVPDISESDALGCLARRWTWRASCSGARFAGSSSSMAGEWMPFTILRTSVAQSRRLVQDVSSGAVTYGHRFLTTSGRAGRAVKSGASRNIATRLLENFVILERSERHDKIARELDAKALRLKTRVSRVVHSESELLDEVPDLVEYPSVIAGTFASEFTDELPSEVLTTTLIHHQHYFPVEGEDRKLKPAFLAVINTEPDNERTIARNAERVVTARLRDALFFWETDRRTKLEGHRDRLSTLLFHKRLGTYKERPSESNASPIGSSASLFTGRIWATRPLWRLDWQRRI